MMLASPSNSTPSSRFAVETASGLKTRLWVEEVIGRRLPEGDFAAGFKDGVGMCELMNVFKPGTIPKIETSTSPFHQMANICCFLRAIRVLGVREQVMFETLVRAMLVLISDFPLFVISQKAPRFVFNFVWVKVHPSKMPIQTKTSVPSFPALLSRDILQHPHLSFSCPFCTELQRYLTKGILAIV